MSKAATTRRTILQKAFELIYVQGYQATSIDNILATTAVTKGAFYYHFSNKDEMGIAIIREILKPALTASFARALQSGQDPPDAIYSLIRTLLLDDDFLRVEHGCPAANLTQEMAPWNAPFREALDELTQSLTDLMTQALEEGKKSGTVRSDVNAAQATMFIVSGYWGIRSFGKLRNSAVYQPYLKELKQYLHALR